MVGGLATAGLIAIYLPLCDGRGRQVSFSVAEELLRLSVCEGGGEVPALWQEPHTPEERAYCRFKLEYNPQLAAIAWEQALTVAGVRILYGTSVCAIDQADGMIRHVIVENKSGRSAIAVKSVIDATGDAGCNGAFRRRNRTLWAGKCPRGLVLQLYGRQAPYAHAGFQRYSR